MSYRGTASQSPSKGTSSSQPPIDATAKAKVDSVKDGYPATELVKRCLKLIASNIGDIPRDVNTFHQVFNRTNYVYEGVLALIGQIERAPPEELDLMFGQFDTYTTAIPRLERFLFDFVQAYGSGKFRDVLPPTDTTANGVLYVQTWKSDRDFISKSFEDLKHEHFKGVGTQIAARVIAEYIDERKRDDTTLLKALNTFIQANILADQHIEKKANVSVSIKAMKGDIRIIMERASSSPYNEAIMSIVIRLLMYFSIPCTIIVSKNAEDQWKVYLRKLVVWEAFSKTITKVKDYLNAPKTPTDEIEALFTEIEKIILNLGDTAIATTDELISLFRLAPNIVRQYHCRSVALIKSLYYLDGHSRKPEQKAVSSYRYDLKQVMTECVENLTALSKIKLDLANFSTESAEYKAKAKEVEALWNKTKALFETLKAASELPRHVDAYNNGVTTDETHVKEAKDKLLP